MSMKETFMLSCKMLAAAIAITSFFSCQYQRTPQSLAAYIALDLEHPTYLKLPNQIDEHLGTKLLNHAKINLYEM